MLGPNYSIDLPRNIFSENKSLSNNMPDFDLGGLSLLDQQLVPIQRLLFSIETLGISCTGLLQQPPLNVTSAVSW